MCKKIAILKYWFPWVYSFLLLKYYSPLLDCKDEVLDGGWTTEDAKGELGLGDGGVGTLKALNVDGF